MATVQQSRRAPVSIESDERRNDQLLVWAVTFFAVAVLVHNSDHVRRGADSIGLDVFWVGSSAILIEVGVVVLGYLRHRLAPLAATAAGFSLATGYVVVHFLPRRSWLSDSFPSGVDVSPLSWGAASLEVVAAVALGVVGLVVLRRRGGLTSATQPKADERGLRDVIFQPVVAAMAVGNVAIFAISLAQL